MSAKAESRKPRAKWTPEQTAMVVEMYPHIKTEKIAPLVEKTPEQVYCKAAYLGLKKTPEYLASPDACRLRQGGNIGIEYRFRKGQVPPNKGMNPGREATQFKPGNKPGNWKPIGSERYSKEGYLQRKMTDTGYPPRDWVAVHRLLWQEHHGEIPDDHYIRFKDGNKRNIAIENLEMVSTVENMRANSVHTVYPKELAQLAQLRGAIQRKINRRMKEDGNDNASK